MERPDQMKKAKPRRDMEVRAPPIMTTLGMKLVSNAKGKATMTIHVDERFHNPMGTLHGGILTDLADACMGMATISTLEEGEAFTTLELKMNFIRPVMKGELTAEGKVVHRGRTIALAECVVNNKEGKEVARGTATQMVLHSFGTSGVGGPPS